MSPEGQPSGRFSLRKPARCPEGAGRVVASRALLRLAVVEFPFDFPFGVKQGGRVLGLVLLGLVFLGSLSSGVF